MDSALLKSDVERISLQKQLQQKDKEMEQFRNTAKEAQEKLRLAEISMKRTSLDKEDMGALLHEVGKHRMFQRSHRQ